MSVLHLTQALTRNDAASNTFREYKLKGREATCPP